MVVWNVFFVLGFFWFNDLIVFWIMCLVWVLVSGVLL